MIKRTDNDRRGESITLANVSVRFDGRSVIQNRTLSIPLVGTTVISGPSGCGKTTLLRVLMGLQKPDSGSVTGLGNRKLAVVFQEDRLLPWLTARENVAVVSDEAAASAWLGRLGLGDALDQRPATLSGGMKRRVAIARALAYGGDVLLLDEPFTGLDDEAMRLCAGALLSTGVPMVIVTHGAREADLLAAKTRIVLG